MYLRYHSSSSSRSTRNAFNFGSYGSASSISVLLTAALLQLAGYATGETESELTRTGECDATDMFCFADDPMKSTVVRIAKSIFLFVVYLSICMTVANIYIGKRRARDTFTCFALLGMVVIQYYTLWIASMKSFPLRGTDIVRYDCKQSNKGGKRANDDIRNHTINPCWCHAGAT